MESVLGALYLSDDFSHVGVHRFFDTVLGPFYDTHIRLETLSHHPTKVLFELIQSKGCQEFKILRDGDDCLGKQLPIPSEIPLLTSLEQYSSTMWSFRVLKTLT